MSPSPRSCSTSNCWMVRRDRDLHLHGQVCETPEGASVAAGFCQPHQSVGKDERYNMGGHDLQTCSDDACWFHATSNLGRCHQIVYRCGVLLTRSNCKLENIDTPTRAHTFRCSVAARGYRPSWRPWKRLSPSCTKALQPESCRLGLSARPWTPRPSHRFTKLTMEQSAVALHDVQQEVPVCWPGRMRSGFWWGTAARACCEPVRISRTDSPLVLIFAVTRSSPESCWDRFAIVSEQTVELKWLLLNKHNKWFHSSRVKFPLVKMSASWLLVWMYFIWILGSQLCEFWKHVSL